MLVYSFVCMTPLLYTLQNTAVYFEHMALCLIISTFNTVVCICTVLCIDLYVVHCLLCLLLHFYKL